MYAMKYTLKTRAINIVKGLTTEIVSKRWSKKLAKTRIENKAIENKGALNILTSPTKSAFIGFLLFSKYKDGIEYIVKKKYKRFPTLINAILLKSKSLVSSGRSSKNFKTSVCPPEIALILFIISVGFPIIKSVNLNNPKIKNEKRIM